MNYHHIYEFIGLVVGGMLFVLIVVDEMRSRIMKKVKAQRKEGENERGK